LQTWKTQHVGLQKD